MFWPLSYAITSNSPIPSFGWPGTKMLPFKLDTFLISNSNKVYSLDIDGNCLRFKLNSVGNISAKARSDIPKKHKNTSLATCDILVEKT